MRLNIFEAEIKMDITAQTTLPGNTLVIKDKETGEAMEYQHQKNIPTKKFENDRKYHLQIRLVT